MSSRIRIEMFGGFRVLAGEREITRFATQKAAVLLAYMARFPELHPRDSLADMLWPDAVPEAGRASLSQALSMLRRQLEPPGVVAGTVISSVKSYVRLNPDAVTSDVTDFLTALRRARAGTNRVDRIQALQDGVELYRGELLPGYYEDWVQTEQRRLAEHFFQASDTLVALMEESEEHLAAIDYARRAVAIDPLREEGHQQIMRLHAAAGRRADALNQYGELRRILAAELDSEPSDETRQLAEQIEQLGVAPSQKTPRTEKRSRRAAHANLPRGTVTFLLTDIAGSTAQWEKEGTKFQSALEDHHRIMRRLFAEHDGQEVKEAGDSFLVAFESPSSALACAVAAQKAMNHRGHRDHRGGSEEKKRGNDSAAPEPGTTESLNPLSATSVPSVSSVVNIPSLAVRMALYTGEVKLEAGEYHGLALHRASRILTAAHGGQILCSESVTSIVRRDLPQGVGLVDLGVYRLRDVSVPERLFQVNYDDMPRTDFPRLNAEAGYQSNLPLQFTRFFGREEQLVQLGEMLQSSDTRLVTITGPGGTGKTRIALECGNRLLEAFAGAVWFVPLVDLSDPRLIAGAIVDSLKIPRSATADPIDQVAEALSRQPSLLILDNLEQFVDEAGEIVRTLMGRIPTLTFLVTSRQSLNLSGEREFQLAPLATPNGPATPERLTMFESVRLFVDRAQAVRPDFQVTSQNAPAVAELCDRLEGIPLAIELAAARASVLSPAQMLFQLEHRFEFLVSRRRDAAMRHQTLRAAIDWSYQLLSPDAQRIFAQLSVFRGGWTTEAAQDVCEEPNALESLERLTESSLIRSEDTDLGMRFRMLETLREFARDQLLESGGQEAIQIRHGRHFVTLAIEAAPKLNGLEQAEWLNRLQAEHDNLRAALDWTAADPRAGETMLRACNSLQSFWHLRSLLAEGREFFERTLAHPSAQARTEDRAAALSSAARIAGDQADYPAALSMAEDSLAICKTLGDRHGEALSLGALGSIAYDTGDIAGFQTYLQDAVAIYRANGDRDAEGRCLINLGIAAEAEGDYHSALAFYEQSRLIVEAIGTPHVLYYVLSGLGRVACHSGDSAAAVTYHAQALSICRTLGYQSRAASSLENLSLSIYTLTHGRSEAISAARLVGAAFELRQRLGYPVPPGHMKYYLVIVTPAKNALDETTYQREFETGRAMTWEEATDYALNLASSLIPD